MLMILGLTFQFIQLNEADTKESKKVTHGDTPNYQELQQ